MSKKVVVILSVLALLFAGASGGLWYTVQGKLKQQSDSLDKLSGFSGATFAAKLAAPAKVMAKIAELNGDIEKKGETIASNETKITGLERKLKDSETSVAELETKSNELTRARDELKTKSEELQANASKAESRVKELEESLVKQTEAIAKKEEEFNTKMSVDKSGLLTEIDKTREYYSKLYNFAIAKGLNAPLPSRPWDASASGKTSGPRIVSNVFIAEVLGFDARQGIIVLNVGSDAGLVRNQSFNLMVGDTVVAKVVISDIVNAGVSTASIAPGSVTPKLTVGTAVKLFPLAEVEVTPVPAK
jgi:uncharacterized coiled-coil protein SlyX